MIYDINGNAINSAYDINGNSLMIAYDVEGNVVFNRQIPPSPSVDYNDYSYTQKWGSKGIGFTQGFDIYDNKVFWVSKSGDSTVPSNCYVWNLSDGSQALDTAYITVYSGHGNNLAFDYPTLYCSPAYPPSRCFVNTLTNDFTATLSKTLTFNDGSNDLDICVDENDPTIMWTLGHTATSSDRDAPFYISKWDLSNLTDNGDDTYTPSKISTVSMAQPSNTYFFQGCRFHDGILWFASGYGGGSTNAYVYGMNPSTGEYLYTIDLQTTAEPEGLVWLEENGEYVLYVGFAGMILRRYTFARINTMKNRSVSILGDSISTYAGWIPSGNSNFYTGSNCGVSSVEQTWWKRTMTSLEMSLALNNSYSGSRVTTTNGSDSSGVMRCTNLGTNPDAIIVYMGINDFNNEVDLGMYDGTGEIPTNTTTFREAYAVMLNKIKTAYPNALLYCATLLVCERNASTDPPEINDAGVYLSEYNHAIVQIAKSFGANIVNIADCGINYLNMSTYMGDWEQATQRALHPNSSGHELIANMVIADMLI